MPDCVIKIEGIDYVPARAIPIVTDNRFDPRAVTRLLGNYDCYIFARSYSVNHSGLKEIEPPSWRIVHDKQVLLSQQGASLSDMVKAIPAGIVVPLDDLSKALFDAFIEPGLSYTAADKELFRDSNSISGPITRPLMDDVTYGLVMEGMSIPTIQRGLPDTSVAKKGITKQQVMIAFEGIHFDHDHWGRNLATPPDWLVECRVAKGNKKTSATWNPVLIAIALTDPKRGMILLKKLDAIFIGLKDWEDEWKEASALFRV